MNTSRFKDTIPCQLGLSVALAATAFASSAGAASTDSDGPAPEPQATASVSASASPARAPEALGAVIVTARKRSEEMLRVPIAITAFDSKALAVRGLNTLTDIATFTPSVTAHVGDNQHNDRSFQNFIIRGMTPSSFTIPTASVFINGTPVAGSEMLTNVFNAERVEILKGPQNAYFGRSTFAGAINVVTDSPTNEWASDVEAEIGTRDTYTLSGTVSGPIIKDKLLFTLGAKHFEREGSYTNANNRSETLGDQESQAVNVGLTLTPNENLTIAAHGLWFRDDDGPGAVGSFQATALQFNQDNCVIEGTPTLCGTLPDVLTNISPAVNSNVTPAIAEFLANPGGILSGSEVPDGFGVKRHALHADLVVDYVMPDNGWTISGLFSSSQNDFGYLYDVSNLDTTATGPWLGFFPVIVPGTDGGFPFYVEIGRSNWSGELRIATDASKRLRAMFGYSYVDAETVVTNGVPIGPGSLEGGRAPSKSETHGVFVSASYDFTPQLKLDVEGRYQRDEQFVYNDANVQLDRHTNNDFLPRVSLSYEFTPDMMAYVSYAKGINPAAFDSTFFNLPEASKERIASEGIEAAAFVEPEELDSFEVGIKGRFLDGRATISADIYYADWTNQINEGTYIFAADDPANPFNIPGPTFIPDNTRPYPANFFTSSARSVAQGIEVDVNLIPVEHVTLNLMMAYNDTEYREYTCTSCPPYASIDTKGNRLPKTPLFSSSVGAMYENSAEALGRPIDWFARVDYIYRDGVWIDPANTARTQEMNLVNIRLGVTFSESFSIEGWSNNLFNNKSPTNGWVPPAFAAVNVAMPTLVTSGVTLRYRF